MLADKENRWIPGFAGLARWMSPECNVSKAKVESNRGRHLLLCTEVYTGVHVHAPAGTQTGTQNKYQT